MCWPSSHGANRIGGVALRAASDVWKNWCSRRDRENELSRGRVVWAGRRISAWYPPRSWRFWDVACIGDDFGDLLRGHRLAAGLTQEALAERAGNHQRITIRSQRQSTPERRLVRELTAALSAG